MTTETKPVVNRESLTAAIQSAKDELEKANALAAEKMPDIVKRGAWLEGAPLTAAIEKAQAAVTKAEEAMAEFVRTSQWETLENARNPMRAAIRELLINKTPALRPVGATGRITIDEDGQADVTITLNMPKPDMGELESLIAGAVQGAEFQKAGVTSIDFTVANIGQKDAMISDLPTPSGKVAVAKANASGVQGVRSGQLAYSWKGTEYGAKDFLTAVEQAGESIATERKQSFDTALRGTGNGLSNTAKQVAAKLGASVVSKAPASA